jgi:WD40 repeat protein
LAIYAFNQRNTAQSQSKEAQKQKIVADANANEAMKQEKVAEEETADAQRNARESKAKELAVSSTESLSDDPERSILLSIQAVNATLRFDQPAVPAAEDALHQAILSSQIRKTLKGHAAGVSSVAWSPDGMRLATGSKDKTAKVWDAVTGQELLTLKGHTLYVNSVAWSLDGKQLATASSDLTAQIYAMDVRQLLDLAHKRVTRDFTDDECVRYFQSEKCPPVP